MKRRENNLHNYVVVASAWTEKPKNCSSLPIGTFQLRVKGLLSSVEESSGGAAESREDQVTAWLGGNFQP